MPRQRNFDIPTPFKDQGKRLAIVMKECNLNLRELAEQLEGVSVSAISRYRSGYHNTPKQVRLLLINKYKVSMAWFITGTGPMKADTEQPKLFDIKKIWNQTQILEQEVESLSDLVAHMTTTQDQLVHTVAMLKKEIEQLKKPVRGQLV